MSDKCEENTAQFEQCLFRDDVPEDLKETIRRFIERKGEEAGKLREKLMRYRELLADAPPIFTVDRDLIYQYANPAYLEVLGVPSLRILAGKGYGEFHSPELTSMFMEKVEEVFETGDAADYVFVMDRNGRSRPTFYRTLNPVTNEVGDVVAVTIYTERESMVSICGGCKSIKDEENNWVKPEVYFRDRLGIQFSHGLCPPCVEKMYPEYFSKGGQQDAD